MNRIKTKLKFKKSDQTGNWVGFVSINKVNGMIRGVHEDDPAPKKVCVVTRDIIPYIEGGVLYDVEMIPMKDKNAGYIVVQADPHAFKATIETIVVKNAIYEVHVKFGNKKLVFNPMDGQRDSVRDINCFIKVLEQRKDIKDLLTVIDDFKNTGYALLKQLKKDGYYVVPVSKERKAS